MRDRPLCLVIASCLLAAACGGSIAGDEGSGAPDASPDGAADALSDANDASVDAEPPVDAPGVTCDELRHRIDQLRPAAQTCCPVCRSLQCTVAVEDLCCPFSATSPQPELAAAVAEYRLRCPPATCPAIPCAVAPSGMCDPSASDPSVGTCR